MGTGEKKKRNKNVDYKFMREVSGREGGIRVPWFDRVLKTNCSWFESL